MAELASLDRHILLVIATYADNHGVAWPAAATVADDVGCSPVTVYRALKRIDAATDIAVSSGRGSPARVDLSNLALPGARTAPPEVRAFGSEVRAFEAKSSRSQERDNPYPFLKIEAAAPRADVADYSHLSPSLAARLETFGRRDRQLTFDDAMEM
jgi:hypothetical protein